MHKNFIVLIPLLVSLHGQARAQDSNLRADTSTEAVTKIACPCQRATARQIAGEIVKKIETFLHLKKKEPVDKNKVSMNKTTEPQALKEGLLPRGSALLTSSGELNASGITAIIHAASGSMTKSEGIYEPTRESIANSLENSITLAKRYDHKRVAIPFIASGIFADRIGISREDLAKLIVQTTVKNNQDIQTIFVLYGDADTALFKKTVADLGIKTSPQLEIVNGSITDFSLHKATAIINAANMEVAFGGGISGVIGKATCKAHDIDKEAKTLIKAWKK